MPADAGGGLVPERAARIVLRPVASSLPPGFFAFAGGTILLTAATAVTIPGGPPGTRSVPLAVFLLTPAVMMLAVFGVSLSAKPLFGLLPAGWARFALYGGLALLPEDGFRRTVLPAGRRGAGRTALTGGPDRQVEAAEAEPGTRWQL